MLTVSQIRLPLTSTNEDAIKNALRLLRVPKSTVQSAQVAKISVDARRGSPTLVYTVAVFLEQQGAELAFKSFAPYVSFSAPAPYAPISGHQKLSAPPVICGFGPAGMFCALALARRGYRPIVIERGPEMSARAAAVAAFNQSGILNENANIQFGEGGAGTFSDGKLTTRTNDPLCAEITRVLLEHGAPPEIAYQQKPHIGTDELRKIIVSLRKEIIRCGGTIQFNTQLTGVHAHNGRVACVETSKGEIACGALVLAIGHSARDTFEMLDASGFAFKAKSFSVGFRAEHLQSRIEDSLYHDAAGHPSLPRGEYQLSHHVGARCVYTFCMCPGGSVVAAASEQNRVVTNGMSNHARDGKNANAAVVVSVNESDFGGDPRKAIAFQRELEQKAYSAGGGGYLAPAENIQSFLKGEGSLKITELQPTYPRGVTAANLGDLLPSELTNALREGLQAFSRKLGGYTAAEAVLTGVETRTSSPVRLPRAVSGESVDVAGVYPCGEGAGYAGGIMSAAADGLRIAASMIENYSAIE